MVRVKRGTTKQKKREKLLKYTKGFRWGRKSKKRAAKEAILHKFTHQFRGRKEKKRNFRTSWQTKINIFLRERGLKYSSFIHLLKEKNIKLNRKMLADLAENHPEAMKKILEC